jgi:hypothetical protein
MKIYKKTTKTVEEINEILCDICKAKKYRDGWGTSESMSERYDDVTIQHNITDTSYPEGGSGSTLELDICPKCFVTKILPFMESIGLDREYKEWDW